MHKKMCSENGMSFRTMDICYGNETINLRHMNLLDLSEQEIIDALHAGACAYVMKDISTDALKMIIKTVEQGAMWLDPQVVPILREKNCGVIPPRQMSRAMFKEQHANLTQREYEVLKLVVEGLSNNEIAQELTISEHTAKAHVCNIIQKLVVDDRTQAAVKALKEGLV